MSRCLSDRALMRVLADLGTESELAHLTSCAGCVARRRKVSRDVDEISEVLLTTPEPLRRAVPSRRRVTVIAAGLTAVAVAALFWIEATMWKAIQPTPDPAEMEQVESTLANVTASLFSVDGQPDSALIEDPVVVALQPDSDAAMGWDEPRWLDDTGYSDTFSDQEEPQDWIEMDTMERAVFDTEGSVQGG